MNVPDYGTRFCPLCETEIDARLFGAHIVGTHEHEYERWPGGAAGVLDSLLDSLDCSITSADENGNAHIGGNLRLARRALERIRAEL